MTARMPGLDSDQLAVLRGSRAVAFTAGLISLVVGIVLLAWPDRTIKAVAIVIGIFFVIGGLAQAVDALVTRRAGTYWGFLLLHGLIDLAIGLVVIFWPNITVGVLVVLVGIALIIGGITSIISARQVPTEMGGRHLWPGVVSILAGLVVVVWPGETVTVLAMVVGIYLIVVGLLLVILGYQLGKAERALPPDANAA